MFVHSRYVTYLYLEIKILDPKKDNIGWPRLPEDSHVFPLESLVGLTQLPAHLVPVHKIFFTSRTDSI
jgi:hypothetical protein